jgi:4-carboxymuconolactone decarboxylase
MEYGRLPWLAPEDLDDEQRGLYDQIVGGPRSEKGARPTTLVDDEGRLYGQFNALLLDPAVGQGVQSLGMVARTIWTRFEDERSREIAILVIAGAARSNIEWHSHTVLGRAAGLSDEEISSILNGREAATFDAKERLMWRVTRALVHERDLDDDLFAEAEEVFGRLFLMDLVILVGFYEMLARHLRVWRTPLPDGFKAQFGE